MKIFSVILICFIATTFRLSAQTTVISHGYAAIISDPVNGWMLDMANGICVRAGGGVVRIYNKTTGNFDYVSGSGSRTVLLFDWWDDSNDMHQGFSEAAASSLFAALMNGYNQEVFNLDDLHFIGHSRGCIVNSEVIERLLVLGFPVEQATSIDAHDWGGLGITITDYDANPDSINSGVEGWADIGWADSYWQDALFSTNGRAVEGTYSAYMGTITHDGIHDWYLETILDTTMHEGYYFSLVGGGSANRPPRTGLQRNPFFTFADDGIMNGNFERGGAIYQSIAGWWYHGGGGDADIDNTYLVLHSGGYYKIHDRFYFPSDASAIQFDYKIDINDDSGVIPNMDKLVVYINDSIVLDNFWMDYEMSNWGQLSINVMSLRNTVNTLQFELVDKYGASSDINSEIWLDNVHFEITPLLAQTYQKPKTDFLIYPNPASEIITIVNSNSGEISLNVNIYNLTGARVLSENSVQMPQQINISSLSNGIYFVEMGCGQKTERQKLIIRK